LEEDLPSYLQKAQREKKANKKFVQQLKKTKSKKLDQAFRDTHEEVFEEIDCLNCANCCKTLGPKFISDDIDRIARHLGMKPGEFTKRYLYIDEDGDYVLEFLPCPFLAPDNRCTIYEVRPKACQQYPHTDSRGMHKWLDSTMKNTFTCPAVLEIVLRLRDNWDHWK